MSVNCLTLLCSAISASLVTNKHALIAPALQTNRNGQITPDRTLICSAESIRHPNQLFPALVASTRLTNYLVSTALKRTIQYTACVALAITVVGNRRQFGTRNTEKTVGLYYQRNTRIHFLRNFAKVSVTAPNNQLLITASLLFLTKTS